MLAARSVVHATPGKTPSGDHMARVMEQLDITEAMAKKVIYKPALDGGAQLVAAGQAEIGIYPTSEVAHVKGVTIVGMLPAGIDINTVYGGAAVADSAVPDTAAAFVKFMAAPENRGGMGRCRFRSTWEVNAAAFPLSRGAGVRLKKPKGRKK